MGPQQGSNYSIPVIGQRLIEFLRGEALQQSIVYSGLPQSEALCKTKHTLPFYPDPTDAGLAFAGST